MHPPLSCLDGRCDRSNTASPLIPLDYRTVKRAIFLFSIIFSNSFLRLRLSTLSFPQSTFCPFEEHYFDTPQALSAHYKEDFGFMPNEAGIERIDPAVLRALTDQVCSCAWLSYVCVRGVKKIMVGVAWGMGSVPGSRRRFCGCNVGVGCCSLVFRCALIIVFVYLAGEGQRNVAG